MNVLVSIGLPFYNNEATLEHAIKSVFAQTYSNWELILMDDGSSDRSAEIARSINDPRVYLVSDGENKGLVARLNQIATLANGKYVARMDADDMMVPSRLEKQVNYLVAHPEVDLVDCGTYSVEQDATPSGKRGLVDISYDPKQILRHAMLLHASIVGKKEWFLANPYNRDFLRAEDYELWCRTYRFSTFHRLKEPLYIVREGKVNLRNYAKSSETTRKIIKKYGPGIFSSLEIWNELIKSHAKVLLYRLFHLFDAHHILARKRNIPLTYEERLEAENIIRKIEKQTFPSLK